MATDPFWGIADWLTGLITQPEAETTYELYDDEGNKIGTKSRTSSQQSYVGQTVVTDPKTGKKYYSGEEDFDRVIGKIADSATPKIRINDKKDGLVISGSNTALQYANNAKLKDYLSSAFKYADFANENVANAVEQLNADLRKSNERYLVEGAIGGNYDDYKEYQLLLQTMKGTNPEKTDVKVKGYDKNGNPQKWTVKQWIDYYQKEYNATERAKLYAESYAKWNRDKDFTAWTPYIIMSGAATGNEGTSMQDATYGFTPAERFGWFTESLFYNYLGKMLEGAGRIAGTVLNPASWSGYFRKNRLNDIAHSLGHAADVSLSEAKWMSEDAYNKKIDSIVGKSVNDLTSEEQAFLAVALGDKLLGLPGGIGLNTKEFITEENSDIIDRGQIEQATSYQDYINARDNLSTMLKYDEEVRKGSEHPFKGIKEDLEVASEYSPFAVGSGAFLGTMLRMWLQSGIISGVTKGTFNPMNLSDEFAETLVSFLERRGAEGAVSALNSGIGKFMLMVAAEIPEDIIQSAIDDALTGHPEYAAQLLTPESLEDNAIQNLIMRVAFTPVHAGFRYAKQKQAIQKALQATKLDRVSGKVASWFNNHEALRQAADTDNIIDFGEDGKSATIRNPDGTTTELDNVAILNFSKGDMAERYPRYAEMLRKKGLVADIADSDIGARIEEAKNTIGRGKRKYSGKLSINDLSDTETARYQDYDAWAYARKQWVDEKVDLGDTRLRSEIEAEFEAENPAPARKSGAAADSDSTVTIYRADIDEDLARRFPAERADDLTIFSINRPKIYDGVRLVSIDASPSKVLTNAAAEGIILETSDVVERGGDVLKKYADSHNVTTDTVMAASIGSPKALAELSGRPIIEGGGYVNGLDEGQYGYYTGIDNDFDNDIAATGFASVDDINSEAGRASAELAEKARLASDTGPYDKTINEIVAGKYIQGKAELSEAPSSASYRWESPDVTKTYTSAKEVFADMPVGKNLTEVRQWVKSASAFFMNEYVTKTAPEFTQAYKTVDEQQQFVRNMDYLFDQQRMDGESLEVAKIQKIPETNVEVDKYGVKVKRVKIGEYDNVPLDFEIADRVARLNELGYETHNSHSGIGADHQKPSDAGGGYLDFEGSMSPEKKAAIERAAKKAGMGVHESRNPFYLRTDFVVRQSNTADGIKLEDVIEMANAETVSRYGLDPENWVDDASKKGILSEALDYRGEAEKRIYEEHGGYAQPDDASRRESWDTFFRELGIETKPDYEISGSAIGKTYENEGITYAVNEDDVRFYLDTIEPIMKDLREAGAAGQGKEAFTITGYLPHSDYDPELLTAEDAMQQGVLWREYSGASTTDDDGNFSTGWLNPDLQARYQTFVHNMLWDSLGDNVVVAKYMEEFNADGLDVAANTVENMVGGRRRLAHLVSESDSVKAVMNNLLRNGEMPTNEAFEEAAKKLGATDIIHQLYAPIYGSAGGTIFQDKRAINVKLNSKADWMRTIGTGDGTLYDNGGAMLVNGNADAKYLAKQIFDAAENGRELDVKQMFVDYLMQNQRRTAKGADYVATKWMDKIAQRTANGGLSRRALTAELGRCIYGEGANRVFRFIGRMDTSKLTSANRQALDSLLFRHSALSKVKNTSGITARLNKAANALIGARMKSLFWMNFKNGILQASECIRLFTEFQIGDAATTIKRMATDKDFMAEVDEWVDMLVPERFVKSDSTASVGALDQIMEKSSYDGDMLTVNKFSPAELRKIGKSFDEFASSPVEMGEALKNRVMMAGILQEAERKGLSGNDMFNYVNKRFERIALAANEMGRLNASDNPLFRIGANLKTFQIRQLRMFLNNIHDMNGGKEMTTYIIKNIGWKAGLALIMAKLGYSTAATMGLDPFDLMDDDYTGVDEDRYSGLDYVMLSPAAKLFLSGGFTGYINDLYWASRKAYEDSATVTEQAEDKVSDNFIPGFAAPDTSFDNVFNTFGGFIPGYTAGKRVIQMNELMDMGWAVSATGNKMYEAPSNPFDIATGYLFGRSNTPQARAYYQTPDYIQGFLSGGVAGLGQQLGREFGGFRQFDPMDTQNYTDWFDGSAADEQQWNSGYYYFLKKVDKMQKDYQDAAEKAYTDEAEEDLRNSFNRQLAEVEQQLNKFTAAYEAKHPEGIDARKMRNLTNILNLYQPVMTDTAEEREQRELDASSAATYRYVQAGLPAVTSYSRDKDTDEVKEVYSPQLRSALQGEFGLPEEAAAQIRRLYNDKWKDLGKQYRDRVFSTKGTKNKQAIQNEYINIVRQDLDPIVELYGNNIWSNEDVENIIDDVFNSMIPKYGQSAKSYLKGIYKDYHGQLRYTERSNETISRIRNLLDEGRTAQAKALGRALLQRVQENRTSVTRNELEWLQGVLND